MNLPLFTTFVSTAKYPGIERFEKAIKTLEDGLANKHIWNVDYVDAKDTLSNAADKALDAAYAPLRTFYYHEGGERWRSWEHNDPRHNLGLSQFLYAPSFLLKLKKVKDAPELKPYIAMLTEIAQVAELVKAVKPFIEKGRKPNPNAVEPDYSNTGICPVCMRRQKLTLDSLMVAHGYTVPRGWGGRNGMCIGRGHQAWELSPEGTIYYKGILESALKSNKNSLKKLLNGEIAELSETVRVRKGFGSFEDERRTYKKGEPGYDRVFKSEQFQFESNIRSLTSEISGLDTRIKAWKKEPLKYGGAETQKRWESKLLNGNVG